MTLTLPLWYDLHAHFRQGPAMPAYVRAHLEMGCAGILAMPNTQPPVSRVHGPGDEAGWSIEQYLGQLRDAGADAFHDVIVPLYLTRKTSRAMIEKGAGSGVLRACKYYPPHGTTNAEHGLPMTDLLGSEIFRAMEDAGIPLCIHGEQHALAGEDYLDRQRNAESLFYQETMPKLLESHPKLRVVCEHITTRDAVNWVKQAPDTVAATITPQHLLFTLGHLIQGLKYHLYCLPVVKFDEDRAALRKAVLEPGQSKFFAGTDSAPHTTKATACGCAAGCFTGGYAPQLYAMAWEAAGANLDQESGQRTLADFLCYNGPAFYDLTIPAETFTLKREPVSAEPLETPEGPVIPLPLGMNQEMDWRLEIE